MEINNLISSTSFSELFDTLSKIGGFLGGIAAVSALYIGNKAVKDYWRIKRSNAASAALSKFRCCVDDVVEIVQYKDLYKYPSHPQELSIDKVEKVHPERPARMIQTKIQQLRKELHDHVSQLSGKEGTQLLELVAKLQNYYPHLSSAVYTSIKADEGCLAAKEQLKPIEHHLHQYRPFLADLSSEAEQLLVPIIETTKK